MSHEHANWKAPSGAWQVSYIGIALPPGALVLPDKTYKVSTLALCGSDEIQYVECSPITAMTAIEFARRVQVLSSIQHVTRRACAACRDAYKHALTAQEKRWLYTTQPQLGPIIGIEVATEHGK